MRKRQLKLETPPELGAKKKSKKKKKSEGEEGTLEEVLQNEITNRKASRKINYEAVGMLFDEEGDISADLMEDAARPGLDQGDFAFEI